MEFLKNLFLNGQIPKFMVIKRILFWLAVIIPFSIFLSPRMFGDFGEVGFWVLFFVLIVRPLSNIFPKIGLFRCLVILRKEFGIFSGMLILGHFVGFLLVGNISIFDFIADPNSWNLKATLGWGMVGVLVLLPILLTSNKFAMIWLKKAWKVIQRFSYLLFIAGGIHAYLLGGTKYLVSIFVVMILWIVAALKKGRERV